MPPELARDLSAEYESSGASAYDTAVLDKWQRHRNAASVAGRRQDWLGMASELRRCLALRPDWAQGYLGLHSALIRGGDDPAAWVAVEDGYKTTLSNVRRTFKGSLDPRSTIENYFSFSAKLKQRHSCGAWDSCAVLGLMVSDLSGASMQLYRGVGEDAPLLLDTLVAPLRLLFLDVDGVLNVGGTANCGALVPELVARLHWVLVATGAVVVLSSSWRLFAELRPLIIAALPAGLVVGQTALGFHNHLRPREIADFLDLPAVQRRPLRWAVVDDMDLGSQAAAMAGRLPCGFPEGLERNFVRTDKTTGLDETCAGRLMHVLLDGW